MKTCETCLWYKPDYGIHCMNGWSRDGQDGKCQYEVTTVYKTKDDKCSHWEKK
jgi:hypothetical protein